MTKSDVIIYLMSNARFWGIYYQVYPIPQELFDVFKLPESFQRKEALKKALIPAIKEVLNKTFSPTDYQIVKLTEILFGENSIPSILYGKIDPEQYKQTTLNNFLNSDKLTVAPTAEEWLTEIKKLPEEQMMYLLKANYRLPNLPNLIYADPQLIALLKRHYNQRIETKIPTDKPLKANPGKINF